MMVLGRTLVVVGFACMLNVGSTVGLNDTCNSLGCFSMSSPWYSWNRPVPAPQSPEFVDTQFYLYTRNQPTAFNVTKLPNISLDGSDFNPVKKTFFVIHGFLQNANLSVVMDLVNALTKRYDCNVFTVDYSKGVWTINYLQAVSNARIAGAELTRLGQYLITQGSSVANWHVIGHSLGAHVASYLAKAIPKIARLTGLDVAQPMFEGYSSSVRFDDSDALFVEAIHTNALPFIPSAGLGFMSPVGHVDYYVNYGLYQPLCFVPPPQLFSTADLSSMNRTIELLGYVTCPHGRSLFYYTESVANPNCEFWGRRSVDITFGTSCAAATCSPMGMDAVNYAGRGTFVVLTNGLAPYCKPAANANSVMPQYAIASG